MPPSQDILFNKEFKVQEMMEKFKHFIKLFVTPVELKQTIKILTSKLKFMRTEFLLSHYEKAVDSKIVGNVEKIQETLGEGEFIIETKSEELAFLKIFLRYYDYAV